MGRQLMYIQPKLKEEIRSLAKEEGIPMSHLIAKAIALYKARKEKIGRAIWYAFKLINSWSMVKASLMPSSGRDQLAQFNTTLRQIRERLGIKTPPLTVLLDEYRKKPSKELTMKINDLVKDLAVRILAFGVED